MFDTALIALFPFMKGITTSIGGASVKDGTSISDCTISVYEGNYDSLP